MTVEVDSVNYCSLCHLFNLLPGRWSNKSSLLSCLASPISIVCYKKCCLEVIFSIKFAFVTFRWNLDELGRLILAPLKKDLILGGIDNSPALIVPGQVTSPQPSHLNGNSYQNSDSTDSPVTSPTTMPGSPADQLINGGGVASPQGGHTGRSVFWL